MHVSVKVFPGESFEDLERISEPGSGGSINKKHEFIVSSLRRGLQEDIASSKAPRSGNTVAMVSTNV